MFAKLCYFTFLTSESPLICHIPPVRSQRCLGMHDRSTVTEKASLSVNEAISAEWWGGTRNQSYGTTRAQPRSALSQRA